MPIIGTYGGVSIVAPPAKPGFRQVELIKSSVVGATSSPFTRSTKVYAFPGGDLWTGTVTLPQLSTADMAAWSAFLAACRGMLNVFPLNPMPLLTAPRGTAKGKPVIAGVNPARGYSLATRGWKPNQAFLLKAGDRLQIGATPNNAAQPGLCRYHEVTDNVASDAAGNATIPVWPSLREDTVDGGVLVLRNPVCLFRFAANDLSILTAETRLSGLTLKIMEAR